MSNDVEKRWHDPAELRRASWYVGGVLAIAVALVLGAAVWGRPGPGGCDADPTACPTTAGAVFAVAAAAVLLLGGLGGFVVTYLVWRRGGTWPIWHGAGWLLLTLFLACGGMVVGLFEH